MGEDPNKFARLDGAEIFAEGRWNNISFTERDLDGIVNAFNALGLSGKVPLKLGHEGPDARRDPRSQFAMGWVRRIWRDGKKLKADFDIPDKVHSFIKDGLLKNVSVELLKDVAASSRKIPWVLDAVALLGADQPAVGVLEDLQALTMTRDEFRYVSCHAFSRADGRPLTTGVRHNMTDENKGDALQRLTDQVLALSQQVADLSAENQSLKTEKAEFVQVRGRLERLQKDVAKDKVDAHRKTIFSRLEAAVKAEDIKPAARERFNKVYRVDDDEAVMKIDVADVEEFIKENPNTDKKVKRKVFTNMLDSPTDDVGDDVPVDQEAAMRVDAMLRKQGKDSPTADDIQAAAVRLFRANPDLAQRYKANADAAYGD